MIIAGFGCRKGVSSGDVLAALDAALDEHHRARDELATMATGFSKAADRAIVEAAARLGIPLVVVDDAALKAAEPLLLSHSTASRDATGSWSLSEASALAAAGKGARLLGSRTVVGSVTCALVVVEASR